MIFTKREFTEATMKNIEPFFPKKLLEGRLKRFDLSALPDAEEKQKELAKWREEDAPPSRGKSPSPRMLWTRRFTGFTV